MNESPFSTGLKGPASQQEPPPAQPAPPPAPPAVPDAIEGHVVGRFSDEPLCALHFPSRVELTRLAHLARGGQPAAFVGTGHEYTALHCPHVGPDDLPWRLGDHMVRLAPACLAGEHDRCLDKSCQCDCGNHDARALAAASADSQLASALKEISATFAQRPPDPDRDELLDLVRELQGKVRALEAADAPPARTCRETTKAGGPCKGTPGEDGLCAAHKPATAEA